MDILFPEKTGPASGEGSTADVSEESNQNQPTTSATGDASSPAQPSGATCNLCGNFEVDASQRVVLDGNEVSCGQFDLVLTTENVAEGSNRCLNFRGQYFDKCCNTIAPVNDRGDGGFEKCSLCEGNSAILDKEAEVLYLGVEVTCNDLDTKVFVEQRVASNSPRCDNVKTSYDRLCCMDDGQPTASSDASASSAGASSPSSPSSTTDDVPSFTISSPAEPKDSSSTPAVSSGASPNQPASSAEGDASSRPQPSSSTCSLCGNSQLDASQRVVLDGDEIPCGQFDAVFTTEKVEEGSDRCLNFRGQYFGECCSAAAAAASGDDNEEGGGSEKCSICGDDSTLVLDAEATVWYSGEEVTCDDLEGRVFVEQRVVSDSPRCDLSRTTFQRSCCVAGGEQTASSNASAGSGGASAEGSAEATDGSEEAPSGADRDFSSWSTYSLRDPAPSVALSMWSCMLIAMVGLSLL